MKGLEDGRVKVQRICEDLKREVLEPAQHDAQKILENAREQSGKIIAAARSEADKILQDALAEMERRRAIFDISLKQASRHGLDALRSKIESQLFHPQLSLLIEKGFDSSIGLARLITVVINAIEKEGLDTDMSVAVSSKIPAREVNELLAKSVIEKLKEQSVLLDSIKGGVKIKLVDEQLTIDISTEAIQELVINYIRSDFRDYIFQDI